MKFSIATTLLVQSASAFNWNWGWCGFTPPSTSVTNFDMDKFTGHWYEIQRDNNLKPWPCVTQEALKV
jgi:lipocalin